MSVFIRRFTFDPGDEVLLEIESVNILDLDPPAQISGVGTGTVICVGEFENGPFAAQSGVSRMPKGVYEVAGSTDFVNTSGSLGFVYAGVSANNPCARARKADSAVNFEYWNGNGFVQLSGKRFRRLLIARADTSVGSIEFKRQAFFTGAAEFSYNLEPAQAVVITDAGTDRTATFTAAAATVLSGAGTYPNGFVGGETLTLGYDDGTNFTTTFLAGDTTRALTIARINQYAGFTFATADGDPTKISLTGIRRGNSAQVRVVSGSTGVLAALGLSAATTPGTGNVANIDAVTFQEVKSVIEAGMVAGLIKVTQDANGALRVAKQYSTANDWMTVKSTTTATALGLTSGQHVSNTGRAYVRSGGQTYPNSFVGGETLTLGDSDSANFTVLFEAGDTTQALTIARINQYAGYTMAYAIDATHMELMSGKNGGSVRVISASAGVFTALGLAVASATAVAATAGRIPAGTVVQNSAATNKLVTMQDITTTVDTVSGLQSGVGPYTVKLRHATDDGTGVSASAGTLKYFEREPELGSFIASNPALVNAALSESAIDAAYSDAIDATKANSSVAKEANLIFSARQSNSIRKKLRANALEASAAGCFGRMAFVRPPLNTTKGVATSGSTEPGVGATREQRVVYCYPGANTTIPLIQKRGLSGGAGFTADGTMDVGFDGFVASICSQLPPEENPGQSTTFTAEINGLESGDNVQGFEMGDYITFKAKGIAALRMDDGTAIVQSGCTSVDPGVYPQLKNIARRRMADFLQDSMARRAKAYGKKLSTFMRRTAFGLEIRNFMKSLLSIADPSRQRIAGFTVDIKRGNTPESLAAGRFRIIINVRTLASLDSIELATTIGENVTVEENFPQAA